MARFKKASDIKVGVIGYGGAFNTGKIHLNEMKKAGMAPIAVCEIDPARLKVAQHELPGIDIYASVVRMLTKSDVNLITIITPHNTHAKLALQCLRAGRHVVCEKPLALTTAECDKIIAEAMKRGLVLSTYHNRHWDGSILRALKLIKAGRIGDVVRVDAHMGCWAKPGAWWRSSKSISGGAGYDWGVHLLEYALQIADSQIVEVTAFVKDGFWTPKTRWKADTIEDEFFGIVRFANGMWSSLRLTSIDSNPRPTMVEITGTKGTFGWDYETWKLITPKENGERTVQTGKHSKDQWWRFYKNIAEHLTKGTKLVITGEWSRRPIHILDLMGKSAKKGVSLKPQYR